MATVVQIELQVDEKGAVTGVRSFDAAVKGSAGSVNTLDATLQKLNAHLDQLGTKGKRAIKDVEDGVKKTGIESLGTLERTRLLTEEFGIRLPRAMVHLIAESKVAQAAIGAVGMGIIGLGAIQVGVMVFSQMAEGAKRLWDEHLSLTKAASDYYDEVEKTKQQEFGNTHSIENTRLRIDEATEAVKGFHEQAKAAEQAQITGLSWRSLVPVAGDTWETLHQRSMASDAEKKAMEEQKQADKLNQIQEGSQFHEERVSNIELMHAGDSALQGQKKITSEFQKRKDLAAETRRYEKEQDQILGNPVTPNAGAGKEAIAVSTAKVEEDAQIFTLRREQAQELAHLREQALEAGLRGVALYKAQEAAAIEELKFKDENSVAFRNAVHAKFHAEEMKRLEDQVRETEKIERTSAASGKTGIAKIQAEGANKAADIRDSDFQDADSHGHSALADRQRAAAHQETNAEIIQSEEQFTERVGNLVDERATRQISGFARIRGEAQKQISALEKDYQKEYGNNVNAPDYQAHVGELNQGRSAIAGSAQDQTAELAKRNADETAQIESEAHVRSLNAEKQRTAAIEAEYRDRLAKYQEELTAEQISQDDFNRRVAAAAQERDADMVQAAREAREKMAGEFDSFFKSLDHPTEALKNLGDKVAGEAAATLMQKIQQHGHGASATPVTPEGGIVGILTGGFGGLFGKRSKTPGATTQDAKAELPHAPGVSAAHDKVFTVAQATIHVGSASFAGLGGGFGGGGFSGGGSTFVGSGLVPGAGGGSTGLFPPGGNSFSGGGSGTTSAAHALSVNGAAVPTGGMVGGAGDASSAPAVSNFNAGSGTAPPPGQNKIGGILGDLKQGMGLVKQGAGIFGGGGKSSDQDQYAETQDPVLGGKLNADGTFTQSGSSGGTGGMLGGGGIGANAAGAVGGALGLFSAYEGNGGFGGAASGAMSGMELGMSLGGPIGAAIGAAGGAILGAIGFGGREKARVYDLKQVRPRLANDMDNFEAGSMDYLSAYSDIESLSRDANMTTNAMGPAAKSYYQDTIKKEIKDAEGKLTAEQRAGRSKYTTTAAQFDVGTDYVHRDGMAVIHRGERIFPSDQNQQITRALKSGASLESMHRSYQAAMSTRDARRTSSGGGERTMNMNVHAIDAKGVSQFFDKHKHIMRRALNSSYNENSGGADA